MGIGRIVSDLMWFRLVELCRFIDIYLLRVVFIIVKFIMFLLEGILNILKSKIIYKDVERRKYVKW